MAYQTTLRSVLQAAIAVAMLGGCANNSHRSVAQASQLSATAQQQLQKEKQKQQLQDQMKRHQGKAYARAAQLVNLSGAL